MGDPALRASQLAESSIQKGFVSGHDPRGCEKPLSCRLVSGHDFSRADKHLLFVIPRGL